MKKYLSVLLFLIIVSLSACGTAEDMNGNEISKQDSSYINKAVSVVNKQWKEVYSKNSGTIKSDKTVEIINTRIIHIKENSTEEFKDVEAVVEFDILSDYYGSAPYYMNIQQNNSVVFYKDGSNRALDIFRLYRTRKYITDYSDVIDTIVECGTAFNTGKIKTNKTNSDNEKYVTDAIELIKAHWAGKHRDANEPNSGDGTLKIINTKLLLINEKSQYSKFDQYFGEIKAIVEFELYSDYFGSAPYYVNAGTDNMVIFYKNGKAEVSSNYLRNVGIKTYDFDFSDLFSEVFELGSTYNETLNTKSSTIAPLDEDFFDAVDNIN